MADLTALEIIQYIDPSRLDYQEWVNVGMALKDAGYTAADWDAWSRRDPARYHQGESFRKWTSFQGSANPVTAGTLVQLAKDQGWVPERKDSGPGYELEWDAMIGGKGGYWVTDAKVEIAQFNQPMQISLF